MLNNISIIIMRTFNILYFVLFLFTVYTVAEFPSDIKRCKAEDVVCITDTINDIIRKNPHGRDDIGLPNIDPYNVKKIILSDTSRSSSLNLDLTFFDVEVFGLTNAKVEKSVGFQKDPKDSKFEIYGLLPKLELNSKYEAKGRILILPIEGKGDSKIIATNVKVSIKFKPSIVTREGKTFFEDNKVKVLLEPERLQIKLDNLFNGNKELGDNMNTFLNENWKDVWVELAPNVNAALADILKNILANVFKKINYDEFYSDA